MVLFFHVGLSSSILQVSAFTPLHPVNSHIPIKRHPSILPLRLQQDDNNSSTGTTSSIYSPLSSKKPLFQPKSSSFVLSIFIGICTWLGVCDYDKLAANAHSTNDNRVEPSFFMTSTLVSSNDMNNINSSVGGGIDLNSIRQSLVSPTDDKPQITMQGSSVAPSPSTSSTTSVRRGDITKTKSPIMEGMVYLLKNSSERPDLNDNIILTLSSTSNPDNILAGAKYKVYKAKFPFNFKMYDENVLKGKEEEWKQLVMGSSNGNTIVGGSGGGGDFLVTARICPEEITVLPCKEEESTYFARGVSKLLKIENLPGANEGDIIRTAVSLPLQKNK